MFRSAIVLSLLCCLLSADGTPQGKALEINSKNVNAHKALYDRRPTKYQKSRTKYSDMISEEIPKPRGALPVDRNLPVMCTPPPDPSFYTRPLPPSVDYREQCMSPVRDQRGDGDCVNTCWSFSVTGALEYYYCNRTGQAVEFSKKYLVDCVGGNSGCNDGYIDEAMKWLINNKRIPSEASYRYNTINGLCHQVQDVYDLSSLDGCISGSGDDHLTRALAFMGPASILIDADIPAFVDFKTTDEDSVFEDKVCLAQRPINHAVLAVGYGTTKSGTDYYIIKNSWGPNWGLKGYAKIRRGENYCNTTSFVLNPDFK